MYAYLMTDISGLEKAEFNKYFEMVTVEVINGIKASFLHYNHLLDNKRATNRPKDHLDVLELERINNRN